MKRRFVGVVVSDKMEKTRVVAVERAFPHPKYRKIIRKRKKYYVHDQNNEARLNDIVEIEESRPLSKLKRFRLIKIIKRGG